MGVQNGRQKEEKERMDGDGEESCQGHEIQKRDERREAGEAAADHWLSPLLHAGEAPQNQAKNERAAHCISSFFRFRFLLLHLLLLLLLLLFCSFCFGRFFSLSCFFFCSFSSSCSIFFCFFFFCFFFFFFSFFFGFFFSFFS
jgi:hypothetical protein